MSEGGKDRVTPEKKLEIAKEKAELLLAQGRQQGRINNEAYKDAMDLFDVKTMEEFRDEMSKFGGEPTIESLRKDIAGFLLQEENKELWERLVGGEMLTRSELEEVKQRLSDYYYTTHFSSSG